MHIISGTKYHREMGTRIAVAGTGYVGLSLATLLSQRHHVTAVDVIAEKVDRINRRESPIQDEYIERYLAEKSLDLEATLDGERAYREADIVIIAAPTNYDSQRNWAGAESQPGGADGHQVDRPRGLHGVGPQAVRVP